MNKPKWHPWDDDITNDNGWYGRKEMDAYIQALESKLKTEIEVITLINKNKSERIKELESKLAIAVDGIEFIKKTLVNNLKDPERLAFWKAFELLEKIKPEAK